MFVADFRRVGKDMVGRGFSPKGTPQPSFCEAASRAPWFRPAKVDLGLAGEQPVRANAARGHEASRRGEDPALV